LDSEFIVIGGGALGLSTAGALLKQGASVTLLERSQTGRESTWAGGGILSPLCPWDYPDELNRLALRGMTMWPGLADELLHTTGIDPQYSRCGMLVLPPFDVQAALQWCATHGMRAEPRDGGVLLPEVAQARNPRLLQALRARVEKLGGRIVEQCEVGDIVVKSGRVSHLVTTRGEFSADSCIVTAGAWSKTLLGEHALKVDIKPVRGQMLLFKFDTPPLPHILLQQNLYLIPRQDGHLLVGSTLEDVGFDKSTTEEARESLRQRAEALLPGLRGMPLIQHWAGLRPGSPASLPTIGRHPQLENLYLNSGHFRYGVTMAPASVEILLNVIDDKPQPFDVTPYLWH
jgi:glycine oxidase